MQNLLGMDGRKAMVPGPLPPGTPPRKEGEVTLHNPDWTGKASGTQPLVVATVNLILANEKVFMTAEYRFSN